MNMQTEFCIKANEINRFKRDGVPRKDIPYPKYKHAVSEHWKRAKNVVIHRQSKTKNQFENHFDMEYDYEIPEEEEWPYEGGKSIVLSDLRMTCRLGDGWGLKRKKCRLEDGWVGWVVVGRV